MYFHLLKAITCYFFIFFLCISNVQAMAIEEEQTTKPKIVVSIEPLYEIISSLSHGIVKPQVIYLNLNEIKQPLSTQQKNNLHDADIIIWVGKGFEPLLHDFLENNKELTKDKTITLSQYIPLLEKENIGNKQRQELIFTNRQASSDLRFWMDPRLVKMLVSVITPQLVFMDPQHQEEYLENEIIVKAQLKKVENKMLSLFRQLSFEQKQMLAWVNPYLKNRYLNFETIKQMQGNNSIQMNMINCIQKHSFDTIPLNLEYTEKALTSLQKVVEQCSKSMYISK